MKNAKWMLAATMLLTSGMMMGQSWHRTVVAKVPFSFMVGKNLIPAGDCVVQTEESNVLTVNNVDAKKSALTVSTRADENQNDRTVLAFERRGDQYFLIEVSIQGSSLTYKVPDTGVSPALRAENAPASTVTLLAALK
jgi:pectin methylesterase-like acyl-CoA thioesterase